MAEKRQCTEVEVKFDLLEGLLGVLNCIQVTIPENLHGTIHPTEVIHMATEMTVKSMNEMVSALNKDEELQKTVNAAMITMSGLHMLADPKYMPKIEEAVLH